MLNALSEELNWTNTENGALAYHDTGDACLNLFSTADALREASAKRLKDMFLAAYAENPVYAMRIPAAAAICGNDLSRKCPEKFAVDSGVRAV